MAQSANPLDTAPPPGVVGMVLLPGDDGTIVIRALMPDGPAEKAGVKPGDVLRTVDGEPATADAAVQRLRGAPGTAVKITVLRGNESIDFTLTRVAVGPNVALPNDPQPNNPAANGLPPSLATGMRLTWTGGNSTIAGSHMVPDDKGWIESKGQRYSLKKSRGGGGMGYTQLNIIHADAQVIVADVRMFLITDLERGTCVQKGHSLMTGNADALDIYWINPARLALMAEGRNEAETITRGVYAMGDRQYKSISIHRTGRDGYSSRTYDTESGLLLFGGTTDLDPTVLIENGNNGGLEKFEGNKQYSHNQFTGLRATKIPWAAVPRPQGMIKGQRIDYTGGYSQASPAGAGLPALPPLGTTVSYGIDQEFAADCIGTQSLARFELGAGIPPNEVKGSRAFASAMFGGLWIGTDSLKGLQPNQVLDEDPITRYRTSFGGVQGNVVVIVEQGATDLLEMFYDATSGLLVGTRYTLQQGNVGQTQTTYQLVQQR